MAAEERLWQVVGDETGEVDPGELADAMLEVAAILRRLGGAVKMLARRRQVAEGIYVTERLDILWALHAPLPRRAREEPPPAPEDFEEEPEAELSVAAVE